jgi:hypothetical protein
VLVRSVHSAKRTRPISAAAVIEDGAGARPEQQRIVGILDEAFAEISQRGRL